MFVLLRHCVNFHYGAYKDELQRTVEEMAIIHFEVFYYSWD